MLAPNSPLKAAVTALALAAPAQPANAPAEPVTAGEGSPALAAQGSAVAPTPGAVQPKRPAHNLRAVLIARIYEVFPPLCPISCGQMRSIAYITHSADIRHILNHIRALSGLPQIAPERGPPLWDERDAQVAEASKSSRIESDRTTGTGPRGEPARQWVTKRSGDSDPTRGRLRAR